MVKGTARGHCPCGMDSVNLRMSVTFLKYKRYLGEERDI